jgi:hypothetical protein
VALERGAIYGDSCRAGPRLASRTCPVAVLLLPHFGSGFLLLLLLFSARLAAQQPQPMNSAVPPPEAPMPAAVTNQHSTASPCRVVSKNESAGAAVGLIAAAIASTALGAPIPQRDVGKTETVSQPGLPPCPPPKSMWLFRFMNSPGAKPLSPKEKGALAARNVLDPFNALTILATSGISVAADPHSAYGPGMPGFARNVGVSYTQDMTGEFVGTFLIPSIVHQDPRYYRMPRASIPRRIGHTVFQEVWTRGDNGRGMLNYANIVGWAIDDEISNLYVPGRQTNLPASAARYGTAFLFAPTDNLITEFLPDVARHFHIRIVIVQRIINQVAKPEMASEP